MTDRPIRPEGRDEAAALAALGRTIASIARSRFDLDEVLQTVVEEAARLCDADSANIAVRDGDDRLMRPNGRCHELISSDRLRFRVSAPSGWHSV